MLNEQLLWMIERWASIILAFIAIAFTIYSVIITRRYGKGSLQNLNEANNALQKLRNVSESIKSDTKTTSSNIQKITGKLVDSTTTLVDKLTGIGWITETCYPNDKVMNLERSVPQGGKIYVLVVTLEYEIKQFKDVIVTNLKHGRRYIYFLPKNIPYGCQQVKERFINTLKEAGVSEDALKRNLEIREVASEEILCNITLFNPGVGENWGFILPAYERPEKAFSVRLDNTLHDRAWGLVQKWCSEDGSKIIWP